MSDTPTYVTSLVSSALFIGVTWFNAHRDNVKRAEDKHDADQRIIDEQRFLAGREVARRYTDTLVELLRLHARRVSGADTGPATPVLVRALLASLPPDVAVLLRFEFDCYEDRNVRSSKKLGDLLAAHGGTLQKPVPPGWIGEEVAADIAGLADTPAAI